MRDYIQFWLSKAIVDIGIAVAALLVFLLIGLWSIRGQKSYKLPKRK